MTRARNHLSITYPLNAYSTRRSADYSIDQLSRFIDRGVQKKMSRVVVGVEKKEEPSEAQPGKPVIDLRALLRGRFS
jgi:hypothetical protein